MDQGDQEKAYGAGKLADHMAIALLTTVFPRTAVRAAVEAAGRRERRHRALPAWLTAYLSMAMWLDPRAGYVGVLRTVLGGLRWGGRDAYACGGPVPTDGAISRARTRLGSEPLRLLFEGTARAAALAGPDGGPGGGLRGVAVDSTVVDLPPSGRNRAEFGTPAGDVRPQARLVVLADCASLALLGAALDPIDTGERPLLETLFARLEPGTLLLAERDVPTYALCERAVAGGAQVLWGVSGACAPPVGERLPDGTYLAELRGAHADERLPVRVLDPTFFAHGHAHDHRHDHHDGHRDGATGPAALITTLLDPVRAPAPWLVRRYAARWRIEDLCRPLGADLRRPGGVLRSRTPDGVRQELWALLCVYQALRTLMPHPETLKS
ncbi:IS4 family transposase [Streptomyces sp. JV176]|uniref:IS4 family transposase n=1 Tax=Streptomyces sp. JV176 TaxID=858630 RepID=UPI002E79AF34|nr:IS4 family transposase [Streptomyces sp. JV176]MEE1803274.1 IS4 family transposase [Streptomyces sp. JV176]